VLNQLRWDIDLIEESALHPFKMVDVVCFIGDGVDGAGEEESLPGGVKKKKSIPASFS
jgi:hypothetical protein